MTYSKLVKLWAHYYCVFPSFCKLFLLTFPYNATAKKRVEKVVKLAVTQSVSQRVSHWGRCLHNYVHLFPIKNRPPNIYKSRNIVSFDICPLNASEAS